MYTVTTYYVGSTPVTTEHKTKKEAIKVLRTEVKEAQGFYKGKGYKKIGSCDKGVVSFESTCFGTDFIGRIEKA